MKVAMDQIKKILPLVDVVIEVGDARAPFSSLNSALDKVIQNKKRILVFSKLDLADRNKLNVAIKIYKEQGKDPYICNLKSPKEVDNFRKFLTSIESTKAQKYARFNLAKPALRALIVGIPNVGKSTLINALVKKNKASVANTPGHTKSQQLVKLGDSLELFDTPGVLQPNYDDKVAILHLAWLGSIKEEILPLDDIAYSIAEFCLNNYMDLLRNRYSLAENTEINLDNFFDVIADSRKFLLSGGEKDTLRAKQIFVKEFRDGLIGKVVVDDVKA